MKLNFVTVDVFTDRQFGGNPLAVVTNAIGLSTERMQTIAAEFNLAETTFVLPPKNPAHAAEVRIFTPKAEMPFAGHPSIGTAFVVARAGESYGKVISGDRLTFEMIAGLVDIGLTKENGQTVAARLTAPQPVSFGEKIPVEIVAAACALKPGDFKTDIHRPCVASCGAPFLFAELSSRAALAAAAPQPELFARDLPRDRVTGLHLYVQAKEENRDIQARMFAPQHGIAEDPATGSATVALIGMLAHHMPGGDLILSKTIGQGFDMGRPSILEASAEKKAGRVAATRVGGRCVPVMSGTIDLAQ
ncbi:MAG TPA: PhzF family phenazine biosynthesis protein [Bradyrhizobium sp.]